MDQCMMEVHRAFKQVNPLFLYTQEEKQSLLALTPVIGLCQTVVSLSSGSSNFTSMKGPFGKLIATLSTEFMEVNFVPFTEEEFKVFKSFDNNIYKDLTNYNPYLLEVLKKVEDERLAESKVNIVMRNFFSDILRSLKKTNFKWSGLI